MFKRVEKRRMKREEEEALGLDEDMKEILGMHDTDSEESASDSDDSDDEKDGVEEDDGEGSGLDMLEDGDEGEDEEGSEEEGEEEDPDVSVKQALEEPIYVVSVMPEVKACIICPGKVLKGVKMAHERRVKQFKALAVDADPDESAWGILQRNAEQKPQLSMAPSTSSESKRAQKKKASAERQKQRREKQKFKRIEAATKKKTEAAAASGPSTSASTSANHPAPVDTPKSGKSTSKSGRSKSKKAKDDKKKKAHRADDAEPSEPLDSTSPPKKKRKVATNVDGEGRAGGEDHATTKPVAPSATDSAPPKEKRGKGRPRVAPGAASKDIKEKSQDTVTSVKSIVRSTSDRAKNARARALNAATKGGSKGATKPPKRVSVSQS
ncbi:hypothetical protein D9619_004705 [Psilocybe cf. subviscida]|uniref:Uncharacterized protein n=1 Tax=Psilocybe cf. subviscida TaxID=2480587 RepID=A0A8H5BPY7_9AGAR|nr:hypothetical protein D9619_004705 [Psilocybe cf. subviscida]